MAFRLVGSMEIALPIPIKDGIGKFDRFKGLRLRIVTIFGNIFTKYGNNNVIKYDNQTEELPRG
jgi:hypothetical protein